MTGHFAESDIKVNSDAAFAVKVDALNYTIMLEDMALTDGKLASGQTIAAGAEMAFDVTRNGRPVAVEQYLGAKGHLVALRQGDLAFLHVHPDEGRPTFMATFPTAGTYRLFLQFRAAGRVHTAAFTREVAR